MHGISWLNYDTVCWLLMGTRASRSWLNVFMTLTISKEVRSQWPHRLRRRFAVAHLLRFWARIPPGAWLFVWCVLCCLVEFSATSWSLSSRVLPTVVRNWVWSRNLKNEEDVTRVGSQRLRENQQWRLNKNNYLNWRVNYSVGKRWKNL